MMDDSLLARCPVESARTIEWLGQTDAICMPTNLVEIVHDYQHDASDIDMVERREPGSVRSDTLAPYLDPCDYLMEKNVVEVEATAMRTSDVKENEGGCLKSLGPNRVCCRKSRVVAVASPADWTLVVVPVKAARVSVAAFTCRSARFGVDCSESDLRKVYDTDADGNAIEYSEMVTHTVTDWSSCGAIEIAGFDYTGSRPELQYYVGYHFERDAIERVVRGAFDDSTRLRRLRVTCDSTRNTARSTRLKNRTTIRWNAP